MKKITIASILTAVMSVLLVGTVCAGIIFDYGTVAGTPPVGLVNWTAWIDEPGNILSGGMPWEILTEDNTNSASGVNGGYVQSDTPIWLLQVVNFEKAAESNGDTIKMIFGGLGSTPQLWDWTFDWTTGESVTIHGAAPLRAVSEFCPVISDIVVVDNAKTVTFTSYPNRTYYVYKSTQQSGAENDASGGRYLYFMTVPVGNSGVGTFTDNEPLESWYTVIPRDDVTGSLGGCHSDEAAPTALTMGNLDVSLSGMRTAVNVRWETYSEVGMSGFNVYRSEEPYGFRMMLNNEPIPAENLGLAGDEYLFVDHSVLPGHTYYYWVEEWRSGEVIGPEAVTVGYLFYLPFVLLN